MRSNPSRVLTRRTVLKSGTAGLAALAASGLGWQQARAQSDEPEEDDFDPGGRVRVDYDETMSFNEELNYPPMLGRVEARVLRVLEDPWGSDYNVAYNVFYSNVLPIQRAIYIEDSTWAPDHNPIWFDVGDGYIHSSWVVPVKEIYNEPEKRIPEEGFWGEITVPTSWQHYVPKLRSERWYDYAYGALFRVVERTDEGGGRAWYRIEDDVHTRSDFWVQAAHVRRIKAEEFAPISADVPAEEKLIVVNLQEQTLMAYEGDTPVFHTRCATGDGWEGPDGRIHNFYTPRGQYRVFLKRPSRHMRGGATSSDYYDLPGVPWCMFFHGDGIAIHGTYWHNDYGHRRSHGCVNVSIDAAKWLYRWATPSVEYDTIAHWVSGRDRNEATRVHVI